MAVWGRIAAAATHRRSWVIALMIAAASGVFMTLIGFNTGADKPPLLVPQSAESARAAALLKSFPGEDQVPAILVVSRRDGSARTPSDLRAADSARQRALVSAGGAAGAPLIISHDGRAAVAPVPIAASLSGFALNDAVTPLRHS